MIGRHYDTENYNCAHFVADWYREKLNLHIPTDDCFELSFVRWLRYHFKQVDKPVDNCLVRMTGHKFAHVGIYADNGVYHNYKNHARYGSVVHWPVGVVKRNYEKVTYWVWLK